MICFLFNSRTITIQISFLQDITKRATAFHKISYELIIFNFNATTKKTISAILSMINRTSTNNLIKVKIITNLYSKKRNFINLAIINLAIKPIYTL